MKVMRIAYLAAGAGGMYCGSCLRDNRLAATLLAQGRDVVLIPLYAPIRTDEIDVSGNHVYFGGVNVYLRQKSPLFRHLPGWFSRMLDAPLVLKGALRLGGNPRPKALGVLTISMLQGENGAQRSELARLIRALRKIKPDLVNLPNLMFVGLAGRLKAALSVPVLCTLTGEDIFLDNLPEPYRREAFDLIRQRCRDVDGFVAVTSYYADHATKHFDLPRDRVHIVRMGVRIEDIGAPAGPPAEPFIIGYLARICPEKGLENLCAAFIKLRHAGRNCRLRVAGHLRPADRQYLERVRALLRTQHVDGAFEHVGEVDRAEKLEFLRSLHVLSVPTVYHEAKGFYVLEAMACGVPVVQPRHGSFPELLDATGGGLLYDPAKPEALAKAIATLMDDPQQRGRLAKRGRCGVGESFTNEIMAEQAWVLYRQHCSNTAI